MIGRYRDFIGIGVKSAAGAGQPGHKGLAISQLIAGQEGVVIRAAGNLIDIEQVFAHAQLIQSCVIIGEGHHIGLLKLSDGLPDGRFCLQYKGG